MDTNKRSTVQVSADTPFRWPRVVPRGRGVSLLSVYSLCRFEQKKKSKAKEKGNNNNNNIVKTTMKKKKKKLGIRRGLSRETRPSGYKSISPLLPRFSSEMVWARTKRLLKLARERERNHLTRKKISHREWERQGRRSNTWKQQNIKRDKKKKKEREGRKIRRRRWKIRDADGGKLGKKADRWFDEKLATPSLQLFQTLKDATSDSQQFKNFPPSEKNPSKSLAFYSISKLVPSARHYKIKSKKCFNNSWIKQLWK